MARKGWSLVTLCVVCLLLDNCQFLCAALSVGRFPKQLHYTCRLEIRFDSTQFNFFSKCIFGCFPVNAARVPRFGYFSVFCLQDLRSMFVFILMASLKWFLSRRLFPDVMFRCVVTVNIHNQRWVYTRNASEARAERSVLQQQGCPTFTDIGSTFHFSVSGDLLIWQSFETKQTKPISISTLWDKPTSALQSVTAYVKASQICVLYAKPWHTIEACVTEIMQFFTLHKITQTKLLFCEMLLSSRH